MDAVIGFLAYCAAAVACALSAAMVLRVPETPRADRGATVAALLLTAAWAGCVAALTGGHPATLLLEALRNMAWIFALFRHFANDGRDESLRLVRPVISALALVEALQILIVLLIRNDAALEVSAMLRMLVAVGGLVLVHNLFGGASPSSRRLLGWNSSALALLWVFELNLFTIAYLTGFAASGLFVLRAIVVIAVAAAFAIGASQRSAGLSFRPSRAVTFSTLSLGVLAIYFLGMVALANGFARLGGDLARVTQVGFLLAAAVCALLWLPSGRLRSTARVLALKHFFKHRYDYRSEWLRFTRTIGSAAGGGPGLHERAVQSLADIADSGAGLLLTSDDGGELVLAARWRWPTLDVPARAIPAALARIIARHSLILDLDEARAGVDRCGELALMPAWLLDEPNVWAVVPLLHGDRMVGAVVLARPQVPRRLDWEDFDLLGIAGQHVASYLAEQSGQEALQDAARFEEFNRRMAFVMHDIKNLSSQLGLLARNAERHADNPAFRKDMLITLRNSADKLDSLVARLGRYGSGRRDRSEPVDLADLARRVARRFQLARHIECRGIPVCTVLADPDALDQAVAHLVQNAIDASAEGEPVVIEVRSEGLRGELMVIDTGAGMSAQFVRSELFRPFVSTKGDGFGIGACEARELVRAMGGRLDVESREGLGSRFTVSLPLEQAARLIAQRHTAPPTPLTQTPNEEAA